MELYQAYAINLFFLVIHIGIFVLSSILFYKLLFKKIIKNVYLAKLLSLLVGSTIASIYFLFYKILRLHMPLSSMISINNILIHTPLINLVYNLKFIPSDAMILIGVYNNVVSGEYATYFILNSINNILYDLSPLVFAILFFLLGNKKAKSNTQTVETAPSTNNNGSANNFCPNCGTANVPQAVFCKNCGTKLK